MIKSTRSASPKLINGDARAKSENGKHRTRFYAVRVFYAVFFGLASLAFAFQSVELDEVDMALTGFCALASLLSFMFSVKPTQES